jgi:hypothetical protein
MGDAPAATPSGDGEPGGAAQPGREAPGEEETEASPAWRVKVYRLSDLGTWDDQGTGYARVEYIQVCCCPACWPRAQRHDSLSYTTQDSEVYALIVTDEVYHRPVLIHRVTPNPSMYQHNGGASRQPTTAHRLLVPVLQAQTRTHARSAHPPRATVAQSALATWHAGPFSCLGLLAPRLGPSPGAGAWCCVNP